MSNKNNTNQQKYKKYDMVELSQMDYYNEMDDDNQNNHNNTNFISFMISVAIVVCLVFFLIYSFDRKNQAYDNSKGDIDISKLAEEKYYSISSKRELGTNRLIFFNENNIDISSINSEDVLYVAYTLLNQEDRVTKGEALDECYITNKSAINSYLDNCYMETINKSLLDEQIRNYFSNSINISYNDFKISSNQTCYFIDNNYKCYLIRSNTTIDNYRTLNKFDSYEYEDNKLIVYSYLLTIRDSYDKDYEQGIYMDSKAIKKIDNLSYFESEFNKAINQETTSRLIDYYKDKISKYKTTFVRENNNFVWYSTEKLK